MSEQAQEHVAALMEMGWQWSNGALVPAPSLLERELSSELINAPVRDYAATA